MAPFLPHRVSSEGASWRRFDELTDYQRKKRKKDEELRKYCQEHGIQLVEIWESEYKKNEDAIKEKIALLLG